jgi:hypothetical protein
VLLNWKRPENIPRIIESLGSQPFVDDCVIWDNSGDLPAVWTPAPPWSETLVVRSSENVCCYGRYVATMLARHDWIVTQDDDYLVNNWPELWEKALEQPDVITANMHLNERHGDVVSYGQGWDIMVGWGGVFHREHCRLLDAYRAMYGIDEILLREADRIFAVLFGREHQAVQQQVTALPGAAGPESMHYVEGHKVKTRVARERAALLLRGLHYDG